MFSTLASLDMQLAICAEDVKTTTRLAFVILLLRQEMTTPEMEEANICCKHHGQLGY